MANMQSKKTVCSSNLMNDKIQIGAFYMFKQNWNILCMPIRLNDYEVYGLLIDVDSFEFMHIGAVEWFLENYEKCRENF